MAFKELIKTQLDLLKAMGKSRRQIEEDLGYSEKYIDQSLSRGGNENLLNALSNYRIEKLRESEENNILGEDGGKYLPPKMLLIMLQELVRTQKENIKLLTEENKALKKTVSELSKKGKAGGRRHSA